MPSITSADCRHAWVYMADSAFSRPPLERVWLAWVVTTIGTFCACASFFNSRAMSVSAWARARLDLRELALHQVGGVDEHDVGLVVHDLPGTPATVMAFSMSVEKMMSRISLRRFQPPRWRRTPGW